MKYSGKFITIEGIDGSGKSTLAQNLVQKLQEHGIPVLLTKEPGGSQLGQQLRNILKTQSDPTCSKAEYLLFAADRAQHYIQIILPALEQGKVVISDRWADSSVAYQGYGRGLDVSMIKSINAWATNNIDPDAILYVNIDVQTALARIAKRCEELSTSTWTIENEKIDFWNKVIHGYEELYAQRSNVTVIDGNQSQADMLKHTLEALKLLRNRS
ncbi:MAG: Thymidylate kinase [candidate division TM6 bacterium GW2011_GWF2_36_6]|nr:MAG: Thymidylate kinase [candidate division TM6 bacterium GW2011_GWF2_36_6]